MSASIQPVGGRRDAEPEEQQRAGFAAQRAGFREVGLQALDFGREAGFVGSDVGHDPSFSTARAATAADGSGAYDSGAGTVSRSANSGRAGLHLRVAVRISFLILTAALRCKTDNRQSAPACHSDHIATCGGIL